MGNTVNVLNWAVATNPESVLVIKWTILITSPTQYQLTKGGNFIGTFTIGVQVVQTEVTFTVNASTYLVGDSWEFTSYPFGQNSILLDEPSIPVSDLTDVIINITTS